MLEGGLALLTIAAGPELLAACAVAPMACPYGVADDAAAFYGSGSLVGGVGTGLAGKTSAAGRAGKACSFSGDTRVLLANGTTKRFKDLKKGDLVLAADPETGNEGGRLVEHVWVHRDDLYELSVGGKRLVTTEDHPFWNATDKRWDRADELDRGDLLHSPDGYRFQVGGMIRGSHRTALAYNLTVQDLHTYYVLAGKTPVLVHNDGGDDLVRVGRWMSQGEFDEMSRTGAGLLRCRVAAGHGGDQVVWLAVGSACGPGDIGGAIGLDPSEVFAPCLTVSA
ncbi:Hint domain-containing protein [Pseudosporangium ferrugineum]|nr:Hint domain-containing protein [Pseudosporangium ferrugineum]